jgi:thiol-disulfide isomerase/thioredoxin
MKKLFFAIVLATLLLIPSVVKAQETVKIYFFWGQGCPHCAEEEKFLNSIKDRYPIEIIDYEVWHNRDNQKLLKKIGDQLEVDISGVPFTVVGNRIYSGFSSSSTPELMEKDIDYFSTAGYQDKVGAIIAGEQVKDSTVEIKDNQESNKITLPIFGQIDTKRTSLPVITVIFGFLDGFNPCAMWILLFLISSLIGMKDRRRMWILGAAFITASALAYFLFMTAWLQLIIFIGFVIWTRIVIGILAIFGGGLNLREFIKSRDSGCQIVDEKKRKTIFSRVNRIIAEPKFILAVLGMVILAFAINIIELFCSAGFPATYTQILAINNLPPVQYYLYILLYIFFFMLDDLLVFVIAMLTFRVIGITTRYARWSHLIGGGLMVIIGLLLIFKPEWLMFG